MLTYPRLPLIEGYHGNSRAQSMVFASLQTASGPTPNPEVSVRPLIVPSEPPLHNTFAATTEPNRYSSSNEQLQHIKLEIQSGTIPQELHEEWRLVQPKSPEGLAFQHTCEQLARLLFTDKEVVPGRNKASERYAELLTHDFVKDPVRFLISKTEEPNAWFVKDSSPRIIVVSEGLFKPNKKTGVPPIHCEEDLLIVIGHEMTHAKFETSFGRRPNSKAEEALCDAVPMRLLHYLGRDPSTILSFDERLRGGRNIRPTWYEIADAHLSGPSRRSVYEAALTELGLSLGGMTKVLGSQTALDRDLTRVVFQGVHTSFFDALTASSGYQSLTPKEKTNLLFETLRTVGTDFPIRSVDLNEAFQKIGLAIDRKIDRSDINRWVDCLYEFSKSLRTEYSKSSLSHETTLKDIYRGISRATGSGDTIRPLGPALRKISVAMKGIIDAVEEEDHRALRTSCGDLFRLYQNTPWCRSEIGIGLLRTISWPTFELPNLDRIIERDRPERPCWQFLVDHALDHEHIAFATIIMGMGPDPRLRDAARSFLSRPDSIPIEQLLANKGKVEISAISNGPKDADGTRLSQCGISKSGRIDGLSSTQDNKLNISAAVSNQDVQQIVLNAVLSSGPQEYRNSPANDPLHAQPVNHSAPSTQEAAKEILKLNLASGAQTLLDLLKTPNGMCDESMMQEILASAHFVVFSPHTQSMIRNIHIPPVERNVLELIKTLSDVRSSNLPLYDLVLKNLPSASLQLYSFDRNQRPTERLLSGALTAFLREIAPDLSDQRLFQVLCGAGTDDAEFVPPQIRMVAKERLNYPHAITPIALRDWVNKHGETLYVERQTSPDLSVSSHSAILSLCGQDLLSLARDTPLTGEDLLPIAQTAFLLEKCFDDYIRYITSDDLAKHISNIDYTTLAHDPRELAQAWRILYSMRLMTHSFEESSLSFVVNRCESLQAGTHERMEAIETLLAGSRIRQAELRERCLALWIHDARLGLGLDDNSADYIAKVESRLRPITQGGMAAVDLEDIGFRLANAVVSQRECSMRIESLIASSDSLGRTHIWAIGTAAEAVLLAVRSHEEERNAFLNYLLGSGTDAACHNLADQISYLITASTESSSDSIERNDKARIVEITNALKLLHTEFWRISLDGRAVLAKELFPLEARSSVERSFDFVVEQVLPSSMPYFKETRDLLKRYIHALPEHAQHLAMAALLTAGEPGKNKASSPGAILAKFAESQGPAEIKFVQVLMDAPGLPEDFRRDLISHAGHLKYKTQAPSRAQIFRLLDIIEKRDGETFGHIGPLRGCGSMNIVVKLADDCLCLRRPNCQARAEDGFDIMLRMLASMPSDDPIAQALRPIVHDARERAKIESNFLIAKHQYDRGGSNYRGYTAIIDDQRISLDAAQVRRGGQDYFTMTEMEGEHFVTLLERAPHDPRLRRIAKVILTREFNAILRGNFDCDRHGGQIAIGEKIGHFDFKAMALDSWTLDDHRQLVRVLVSTAMNCSSIADLAPTLVNTLHQMRSEGLQVSKMVTESQKAILSLGDYFKALEPLHRDELIQIVLSAISIEIPPHLQKLYAAELATIALPEIKKNAGMFSGIVTKKMVESTFAAVLRGERLSPALLKLLPDSVKILLPDPRTQIRFEKA